MVGIAKSPHGRRAIAAAAGAAVAAGLAWPAVAASDWAPGQHSAARLLDGGAALAGVEIRLDPGFITYWRNAGEAGVPPRFDFSGSTNLKAAEVSYPAPRLLDEDGTPAYGYAGGVSFAIAIAPTDAGAPVRLDLKLDYAVCSRLCLPVEAHLALRLDGAAPDRGAVLAALAEVPKSVPLGGAGPVGIRTVTWTREGTIRVEAVAPGAVGTLFVEAPDPWYFAASPGRGVGGNRVDFVLTGGDRPPTGRLPPQPLRLTLVAPSAAVEISLPLDAVAAKP